MGLSGAQWSWLAPGLLAHNPSRYPPLEYSQVREPLARTASHYTCFRQKRYAAAANLSEVLARALAEL